MLARSLPDEADRNVRRYRDAVTIRAAIRPDPRSTRSFTAVVLDYALGAFIAIALTFAVSAAVVNHYVHASGALP